MLHIATVHWRDPRWIDVQAAALERRIRRPFRVHANLEGIDDPVWDPRFHRVGREGGSHPEKLDRIAAAIVAEAAPEDLLMFLDGDAFPVRPMDDWMDELLVGHPLAAVCRRENLGDVQPHPCFCLTTVGFWQQLGADWGRGPTWTNTHGETVSDVGARLWKALADAGVEWRPVLRSNRVDLHPVMFALYGGHVYHHGAGFRHPLVRSDGFARVADYVAVTSRLRNRQFGRLLSRRGLKQTARAVTQRRRAREVLGRAEEMRVVSDRLFVELSEDPDFHRQLE
jgi:hypothetical protein